MKSQSVWRCIGFLAGGAAVCCVGTCAANAGDGVPVTSGNTAGWQFQSLADDWSEFKAYLRERGIDVQFGYVNEIASNATGGVRSSAAYADQYTLGTTIDLDRVAGIRDTVFQVTVTERTGRNLVDDVNLGALQLVQEVYGRGQTARLTQFWVDRKLPGGIDWKVGRMTFGEDFASFSCDFQNLTFCGSAPGNLVGNYIFNWPISQWATRLKFNIDGFGYFQVGAYDVNPKYLGTQDALLPVFFSGSTGALLPVELAWLPNIGGLPGSYKIGGWYDTSAVNDVVSDINGAPFAITGLPPMSRQGRFGGYLNFLQQLTHPSDSNPKAGLSAFLNAVVADDRTSTTDAQVAGGLIYTGPFPSRPDDDIALAIGMTNVNSRIAQVEMLQAALEPGSFAVQGTEYVAELHYTIQLAKGVLVRPNIQYVMDPGGTSTNKDALVFGLKTSANF